MLLPQPEGPISAVTLDFARLRFISSKLASFLFA